MLRLQRAPRQRAQERFESDRESLPFPNGGVYGPIVNVSQPGSEEIPGSVRTDYADLLRTIEEMQSSVDTLERELGAELQREFDQLGAVIGRIGANQAGDWPPAAA